MMTRKSISGFPIDEMMMSSITCSVFFACVFRKLPTAFIRMMPAMPVTSMIRAVRFEASISYMSTGEVIVVDYGAAMVTQVVMIM
jgi:hypothetical protein